MFRGKRRAKLLLSVYASGSTAIVLSSLYWIFNSEAPGLIAGFVHSLPIVVVLGAIGLFSVGIGCVLFFGIKDENVLIGKEAENYIITHSRGGLWTIWKRHGWVPHITSLIYAGWHLSSNPITSIVIFALNGMLFLVLIVTDKK